MDNNPPPPYYSGSFNNLNDKTTKEGNPIFTAPPYPPPHSQSYIIGVGSLPLNSNGIPPQPPPPINVNRPIHVYTPKFGPYPLEMDCPSCRSHIVTETIKTPGALPWIILGFCFVLGFFLVIPWCLCCVPFCIDSCLDVIHACPSCKKPLGRFSRV
ncbi:hypothetical protein Mgra_00004396 [Meloidogyne graminicola]|uniref:LITAF domain-containing protein n=1 Tax=Meloidogyne graminicola TaxID=189291 RepID=A0A8S9ZRN9_9BILA|nr:hypothetical protein Mgra_00004396 [Meloidogyne graminicola]